MKANKQQKISIQKLRMGGSVRQTSVNFSSFYLVCTQIWYLRRKFRPSFFSIFAQNSRISESHHPKYFLALKSFRCESYKRVTKFRHLNFIRAVFCLAIDANGLETNTFKKPGEISLSRDVLIFYASLKIHVIDQSWTLKTYENLAKERVREATTLQYHTKV